MDRGSTYYQPSGETTEWEDILIKKGIMEPKTKAKVEEEDILDEIQMRKMELNAKSLDELDVQLEDDYDDDRELEMIRKRRIEEMKILSKKNKFGSVFPITKDEWVKEVNEGSKSNWVIAYMFDHAVHECKIMDSLLAQVASNHKDVKFVSIPSQNCIENWPAKNLPTLFLYCHGELQTQLLTLKPLGGKDTSVAGILAFR